MPYKWKIVLLGSSSSVTGRKKLNDQYKRYLEKGIQQKFGLSGCPLKFSLAGKEARYKEEKP